jgi:starch-binding outer membrane protein, SusD/RagB family
MTMKIFNSTIIKRMLLVCLLSTTACMDNFLDQKPQGLLTDATFLKISNDAVLATNAIYSSMRDWFFHSGGYPILDIMSDDATKGSNPGDGAIINLFENFQYSPATGDISRWYSALYKSVRRSNIVIESVPSVSMDESLKNRLVGEAKFLRAMFYFDLVRAFGDLPKITTMNPPLKIERSPKQEIYDEIILPDLEFAIANLPEKSEYGNNDLGRATKGSARALLAKVYLFLNDFVAAEKYSLEVINSGQYDLEENFGDVFALQGQHGVESIFEIGALPQEGTDLGGNQFANTQGVRGKPNKGWGFNRPSWDLINFYESDDVRKDATIIFLKETIDGVFIQGDKNTPDTTYTDATKSEVKEIETYNQKVWTPDTTTIGEWGCNKRVLRYADILLIAAEALNENDKLDESLTYLNLVRDRANLTALSGLDKVTLREKIWDERRTELAMEGQRFWDLVRTGQADEILGPLGFITGKHELFPFPQSEIDLSEGSLIQTDGWK